MYILISCPSFSKQPIKYKLTTKQYTHTYNKFDCICMILSTLRRLGLNKAWSKDWRPLLSFLSTSVFWCSRTFVIHSLTWLVQAYFWVPFFVSGSEIVHFVFRIFNLLASALISKHRAPKTWKVEKNVFEVWDLNPNEQTNNTIECRTTREHITHYNGWFY